MRLFISWSKPISQKIANELSEFAKLFFRSKKLEIYISSGNISPGERWLDSIREAISNSDVCVIVLSDENEKSRWIHFESGAIAYNTQSSNIIPFLTTTRGLDDRSPLRQFQFINNNKSDIEKLFKTIKKVGRFTGVRSDEFSERFDKYYPRFRDNVSKILEESVTDGARQIPFKDIYPAGTTQIEQGKVFVGAPMAGYKDDQKYEENRAKVQEVEESIRICCKAASTTYWAGNDLTKGKFDGEQTALVRDLSQLKSSQFCVFILFESLPTSVHIEIGNAIALNKRIIIFCKRRDDLPYLLRYADSQIENVNIYQRESYEKITELFDKDGDTILVSKS